MDFVKILFHMLHINFWSEHIFVHRLIRPVART